MHRQWGDGNTGGKARCHCSGKQEEFHTENTRIAAEKARIALRVKRNLCFPWPSERPRRSPCNTLMEGSPL